MAKKPRTVKELLENVPLWNKFIQWCKQNSFPGFKQVPIFSVGQFLYHESKRNDLNIRANSMAFSFFLALFPSLIFLYTLTAYLPKNLDFYQALEDSFLSILPSGAEEYILKDIIESVRPKAKTSFISIGFLLAVYFGSNGILSMMQGFDKTYKTSFRKRKWLETQGIALMLTFFLVILLIVSVIVLIFGEKILLWLFMYIEIGTLTQIVLNGLKYLTIIFLFYSVISLIYRYGPAISKPIKGVSPGSIFATFFSILTSLAFSYFVENFSNYHKVYGTISALIITLIWIRMNSFILIMGFELNAAIVVNRDILNETKLQESENYDDV